MSGWSPPNCAAQRSGSGCPVRPARRTAARPASRRCAPAAGAPRPPAARTPWAVSRSATSSSVNASSSGPISVSSPARRSRCSGRCSPARAPITRRSRRPACRRRNSRPVNAGGVGDPVQVVQDSSTGRSAAASVAASTSSWSGRGGRSGGRPPSVAPVADAQRRREVRPEPLAVVAGLHRHPRRHRVVSRRDRQVARVGHDRARLHVGRRAAQPHPGGEQGGLAPAGGGSHQGDRSRAALVQPAQQAGPGHHRLRRPAGVSRDANSGGPGAGSSRT